MNALERAIAVVSPEAALSRMQARARINLLSESGYTGGSRTRRSLMAWLPWGGDADTDTLPDLPALRTRSRDLYRNTPLATGALNTVRTNVVGAGLKLQSRIDREFLGLSDEEADAWERTVEREFALWAESAESDATRTENFFGLQSLVFLSALMSGDVFILLPMIRRQGMPYNLRVQVIEADRIENPNGVIEDNKIAAGVEVDGFGAPVAYNISNRHPGSMLGQADYTYKRVPAFGARTGRRNVLHLYDRIRPGQRRGVPYLAPVVESLKQLGRYSEAELMAAVVAGMFTVFVKSEGSGEYKPLQESFGMDQKVTVDPALYELGNGAIVGLGPGEDIVIADPKRPNQVFDVFVQSVVMQIGAALEVPLELLLKHFKASYSASRAALLEAWKFFRVRRSWLADRFCQPVYEEWLAEAVSKGRIAAPGYFQDPALRKAYSRAEWIGPSPGQIDPEKEVKAAVLRVENDFSTRSEETQALTGGDWETKYRQRAKEERMRKEAGLSATAPTPAETETETDTGESDADGTEEN